MLEHSAAQQRRLSIFSHNTHTCTHSPTNRDKHTHSETKYSPIFFLPPAVHTHQNWLINTALRLKKRWTHNRFSLTLINSTNWHINMNLTDTLDGTKCGCLNIDIHPRSVHGLPGPCGPTATVWEGALFLVLTFIYQVVHSPGTPQGPAWQQGCGNSWWWINRERHEDWFKGDELSDLVRYASLPKPSLPLLPTFPLANSSLRPSVIFSNCM